jgi:hypothetical protein
VNHSPARGLTAPASKPGMRYLTFAGGTFYPTASRTPAKRGAVQRSRYERAGRGESMLAWLESQP